MPDILLSSEPSDIMVYSRKGEKRIRIDIGYIPENQRMGGFARHCEWRQAHTVNDTLQNRFVIWLYSNKRIYGFSIHSFDKQQLVIVKPPVE